MIRRAFCSAAMAAHRASSYAIADQLSCGTTQKRRTLVLRAPDGPHRAMDCRRIRQRVGVPDELQQGELAAFERSSEAVEFVAGTDTEFVLGSAVPHNFDLVLGSHSGPHEARRVARCPGAPIGNSDTPGSRRAPVNALGQRRNLLHPRLRMLRGGVLQKFSHGLQYLARKRLVRYGAC